MPRGRPKAPLALAEEDRLTLEGWTRRRSSAQALALRARIVLMSAGGASNTAVAERLGVTPQTVGKWRRRFLAAGPAGLLDEPRPGAPRTVGDEQVERVIVATLEERPRDATHWSTRAMAQRTGLSQSTISRIWRAFGLAPHRVEHWKLSKDPLFVEKVRDIVGSVPGSARARAGALRGREEPSAAGWPATRAFTCTSPRPAPRG